jgi:DNA-binding Lrp family transcriptional regulator
LDRRIIAALQYRPRATWAAIAEALDEPTRSVSRRGADLLSGGDVRVVGARGATPTLIARVTAQVNCARIVATGYAARPDCVFAYATTGRHHVVAEVRADDATFPALVLDELPSISGSADLRVDRVSMVHRSVGEWRPAVLTDDEVARLGVTVRQPPAPQQVPHTGLTDSDRTLLRLLAQDGRTTTADLAASARASENTVRRRLADLEQRSLLRFRVVADPALLGCPTEVLVTVRGSLRSRPALVPALLALPELRYLAALGSDRHLLAHFAFQDSAAMHQELSSGDWTAEVDNMDILHVVHGFKRSGWRTAGADALERLY